MIATLQARRAELEQIIADHNARHEELEREIVKLRRSHDMAVGALKEIEQLLTEVAALANDET